MFDFHKDKERYFNIQFTISKEHIIPFIQSKIELKETYDILEIGCAEAGVLKAFIENGNRCIGIELRENRVELAKEFQKEAFEKGQLKFITDDIYNIDIQKDIKHKFDIVILKDVIEHIHNQEEFIKKLSDFLNPDGVVFFGFPPWQMPFGGHQQMCKHKITSLMPYYHLFPMWLYKAILRLFGESKESIIALEEIKETGISLERFEKLIKINNLEILKKKFYLINPIYKYKFNMKPRIQNRIISNIPWLRNFFTTTAYYLIKQK